MATRTAAVTIRKCTASDAQMVAALGARLFAESYGPTHPEPELSRYLARAFAVQDVRAALEDPDVTMLVAEEIDAKPIGYAFLRASHQPPAGVSGARVFEIVRFYVDGGYQGQGVGAALMNECFRDAGSRGADVVWLQVWKEAPWAIRFYSRFGFAVVGSAHFYFGDQIGDDHIMARPL